MYAPRLVECRVYQRRYHLEHICKNRAEACWRRARTPKELKPALQLFVKELKRWLSLQK